MARRNSTAASLNILANAKFAHVPAGTTATVKSTPGTLMRIVLNTNGGVVLVRNGSEVIASIAADAPETTFDYGVYCNSKIIVETGATCDVTVVFD